ncbi:1-acyl-sn-glycerol-3-phosphate acyltransferase [Janibacter sp. GXQ6167]|uniref:1-acyl-sn-glycerol-3-phosphate acyltransferase n=1 Tax=Janibacter sp. GXQ6167 TaxID=3240791 RepID=UPI0035243BA0
MQIPAPPRWLRLILQAIYPVFAVFATAVAVLLAPIAVLIWPLDRHFRVGRVLILAVVFLWEDVGLVVQCWALRLRGRAHSIEDHEQLLVDTLDNVMRSARRWIGFHVDIDGEIDYGRPDRPLVVLARHAGPADSLALAWLLTSEARRIPRVVLAAKLLWDPGVAKLLERLEAYFVPSRSGAGDDRTKGVTDLAASLNTKDALLIFPEGKNWTPKRHADEVARLTERGETERAAQAVEREYVLPPRPRGVRSILAAQPDADVLVVAHTGLELLASPFDIWRAIPFTSNRLLVRGRTFRREDIPTDPDEIDAWLDERWGEINSWVTTHLRATHPDPS